MSIERQIAARGFAIGAVFDRAEMEALGQAVAQASLVRSRACLASRAACFGDAAVPYRATLFDKSAAANWLVVWHQDTALPLCCHAEQPGWGPWSVKAGIIYAHAPDEALRRVLALRVHLDDSTASNGPLRVLPGTHERGVLSEHALNRSSCCRSDLSRP